MTPQASVIITTKDRKPDLAKAVESSLRQKGSLEVIIIDDGSTDGTAEFVRQKYPSVRLIHHERSLGYVLRRNQAAEKAQADIIFSIDDDAEFSNENIVMDILRDFDVPEIAAVAIPFVNVNRRNDCEQQLSDSDSCWITNGFIGTAYAIRANVFRDVGGFRDVFIHQEEEGDLCIRLLQKGYFVRMGRSAPICHFESPQRSLERINMYSQRNLILFTWFNVPLPEILLHLPITIFNGLLWGLKRRSFLSRIKGTFAGFQEIIAHFSKRTPVSRETYWLYRRLKKRGPIDLRTL